MELKRTLVLPAGGVYLAYASLELLLAEYNSTLSLGANSRQSAVCKPPAKLTYFLHTGLANQVFYLEGKTPS